MDSVDDDLVCSLGCTCNKCVPNLHDISALAAAGQALFESKLYKRAVSTFTKAIRINRLSASIYLQRSIAYIKMDRLEDALQDAHRVILLQPNDARGLHRLGLTYLLMGRLNAAAKCYIQAVALAMIHSPHTAWHLQRCLMEVLLKQEQALGVSWTPLITKAQGFIIGPSLHGSSYRAGAGVYQDKIYLFGGVIDGDTANALSVFDTVNRTWSRPRTFWTPVDVTSALLPPHGDSCCMVGHRLVIFNSTTTVMIFDCEKSRWARLDGYEPRNKTIAAQSSESEHPKLERDHPGPPTPAGLGPSRRGVQKRTNSDGKLLPNPVHPRAMHSTTAIGNKLFLFGGISLGEFPPNFSSTEPNGAAGFARDAYLDRIKQRRLQGLLSRAEFDQEISSYKLEGPGSEEWEGAFDYGIETTPTGLAYVSLPVSDAGPAAATRSHAPANGDSRFLSSRGVTSPRVHYQSFHLLNDFEVFNVDTLNWEVPPLTNGIPPPPRHSHSASLCGNKLYIIGGTQSRGDINRGHSFSEIYRLHLDTWAWERVAIAGPQKTPVGLVNHRALVFCVSGDNGDAWSGLASIFGKSSGDDVQALKSATPDKQLPGSGLAATDIRQVRVPTARNPPSSHTTCECVGSPEVPPGSEGSKIQAGFSSGLRSYKIIILGQRLRAQADCVHVFDTGLSRWCTWPLRGPHNPLPALGAAAALVGSTIFMFGGLNPAGGVVSDGENAPLSSGPDKQADELQSNSACYPRQVTSGLRAWSLELAPLSTLYQLPDPKGVDLESIWDEDFDSQVPSGKSVQTERRPPADLPAIGDSYEAREGAALEEGEGDAFLSSLEKSLYDELARGIDDEERRGRGAPKQEKEAKTIERSKTTNPAFSGTSEACFLYLPVNEYSLLPCYLFSKINQVGNI
jgi:hypothetical protein